MPAASVRREARTGEFPSNILRRTRRPAVRSAVFALSTISFGIACMTTKFRWVSSSYPAGPPPAAAWSPARAPIRAGPAPSLGRAPRDPRGSSTYRISRPQTRVLDLAHGCDVSASLLTVTVPRRQRMLLVDDRLDEGSPISRSPELQRDPPTSPARSSSRAAEAGHAVGHLASTSQSPPICMWLSQIPRTNVLPLPSTTRALGGESRSRLRRSQDLAVPGEHGLVLHQDALVGIEQADTSNRTGAFARRRGNGARSP